MAKRKAPEPSAILGLHSLNARGVAEQQVREALLRSLEYNPREIIHPKLDPDQIKEEAELLAGDFRKYIPRAWGIIDPSTYVPNWHIDALAEHLQAVSKGDIQDLLITMPPRHSKSITIVVLWPTWEWIDLPSYRWVFASYAFSLSVRDSIKRRNLIRSAFYRDRWGDRFSLIPEQNTKIRYENDRQGFMLASSVGGTNTGEGGERIVADDPHNVKHAESEQVRKDTVDWWNIVMSTRRNSDRSSRVVVQQRTHEGDVAGDIIEKGGYVHLNLPTEYGFEGTPRCFTSWTDKSTGREHHWEDPRQQVGELLNPGRFTPAMNEQAKIDLGDYQYAAQHGQNPTPPKGQIIQAQWIKYYGGPTGVPIPDWTRCTHPMLPALSVDAAFKEKEDTDFVAGLGWAMFGADIYLMPICIHKRMNFPDTIDAIAEFVGGESLDQSRKFPGIYPFMKIKLIESKANGPAIVDTLQHRIPGMLGFEPGSASKESRLMAGSWRFKAGNVYLPHESIAPWIKEYVYELCAFPKAKKDDYADATSQMLLFIGGDPSVSGEPLPVVQKSTWIGRQDLDPGMDESTSPSRWGEIGSQSRSIWRH